MSDHEPGDGGAGYGKPPKEHQFKPGQSGNPSGRPKGSKNVDDILSRILGEKISITDGGKKMVVEKLEGAVRVLVNEAFKGKPPSLKLLCALVNHGAADPGKAAENPFTDEDYQALMKELSWIEEVRDAHAANEADDPE